jgi:hypothetical protein
MSKLPSWLAGGVTLSAALAGSILLLGPSYASATTFGGMHPDKSGQKGRAGVLCANATVCGGSGFTVTSPGTGIYDVTYPAGTFKGCPIVVSQAAGWSGTPPIINNFDTGCTNGGLKIEFRSYSSDGKFTPEAANIEFIAQDDA